VLASALLALPIVGLYGATGAMVLRRLRDTGLPAFGWFALFWIGIGTYGLAEAAWSLSWLAGAQDFRIALVVLHVKIVASVVAFLGLVAYVVLLVTGRRALLKPLVGAYVLLLVATEAFYAWKGPVGQRAGVWGMRLEYVQTSVEPWWTMLLVALFVPPMIAALAYASLARIAADPALRRRIALMALALLGFFGPLLLGWMNGNWVWWGLAEKALSLVTALAGLVAMGDAARSTASLQGRVVTHRIQQEAALRARARELL
jgi:hypothetical protein